MSNFEVKNTVIGELISLVPALCSMNSFFVYFRRPVHRNWGRIYLAGDIEAEVVVKAAFVGNLDRFESIEWLEDIRLTGRNFDRICGAGVQDAFLKLPDQEEVRMISDWVELFGMFSSRMSEPHWVLALSRESVLSDMFDVVVRTTPNNFLHLRD